MAVWHPYELELCRTHTRFFVILIAEILKAEVAFTLLYYI
jgi:hypothetical protein